MRIVYSTLLYLLLPLVLLHLAWRGLRQDGWWRSLPGRLGFVARPEKDVAVWVHAASVGEVAAALPLLRRLLQQHPPGSLLVTTTTPTRPEARA